MGKAKKQPSISTFLGFGSSFEGTIEFQETMRVDGSVKGKIYSDNGTVIIGEKAVVEAEIIVDVAIITGKVNGTVEASERIEVYPPANVVGDIQAPVILFEAGVKFNGNCVMQPEAFPIKNTSNFLNKLSVTQD